LWLGSGEGLYRFDGFSFERVGAIDGDSPAPTEVYALIATSNGDLWIGTSFNGAILLRNGVAKHFPKFEGIPLNTTVWSLAEDLDGTIWAGTASGLQRFDGSQWRSAGKAWVFLKWWDFRASTSIQTERFGWGSLSTVFSGLSVACATLSGSRISRRKSSLSISHLQDGLGRVRVRESVHQRKC
jgi:hypothetical protein